ncbi:MAG TPA: GyrI-like domain-containing protein [Arthrobacter sp.]|nr:GyrI-like domain-containing protein [Arthrobacter sp.]
MNGTGQQPRQIHLTEQPVAVVRESVPMDSLTSFFDRAFGAVMAAVQMQGASPAGPPFALYHGMPGETVDVEAGFPVAGHFHGTGEVASGALPDTDAFEAIHTGPYDTLGTTYGAIREHMLAEGAVPGQVMWEYYLTDPQKQPDPATWQTRVVWPVA